MLDMTAWLEEYRAMALDLFGERVRFLGLQGSRARGEAGPDSDIDVVLVLDRLEPEDLERYRRGLGGLPDRALVCGFCSGAEELRNWDRGDRFQFWYDTVPLLGRLEDIFPAPDRSDARRAALAGACALYHLCVHNSLHGRDPNVLRNAGKSARFALQAAHFACTGVYLRRREDLDAGLAGEDAALRPQGMSCRDACEQRILFTRHKRSVRSGVQALSRPSRSMDRRRASRWPALISHRGRRRGPTP